MSGTAIYQSDPFESPKLLLDGARRHLAAFAAEEERLRGTKIYDIVAIPNDPGAMKVSIKRDAIPAALKQVVFDLTSNLRSALDHAVYASAFVLTEVEHESGTKFPLGDTEDDLKNDAKRGCRNVPRDIEQLLMGFKVYRSGNTLVWALNKLRNTKSHRLLVPFATSTIYGGQTFLSPGAESSHEWDATTGRYKPKLGFAPDAAERTPKLAGAPIAVSVTNFQLQILIGTGVFRGEPALKVFNDMIGEVERIVAAIEAETERLIRERSV